MSTTDWATKAAEEIRSKVIAEGGTSAMQFITNSDIASIIAAHAEPLVALLRESRREHMTKTSEWCPKSDFDYEDDPTVTCTCSASAWNAKVDAALKGGKV